MPTSSMRTRNPLQSFQAWTAISSAALFAVTWKLWTPQTEFPQVPAFAFLRTAPSWLDWLGVSGVLASLIALLFCESPSLLQRRAWSSSSLAIGALQFRSTSLSAVGLRACNLLRDLAHLPRHAATEVDAMVADQHLRLLGPREVRL